MNLKNKNILVTGGTGFIGSHLVQKLLKEKANVITTYINTDPASYFSTNNYHQKITAINANICNYEKIFYIVTRHHIDFIFHLAAQTLVDVAFYNPRETLFANIIGTTNILEAARSYPRIQAVIIASSDKAYGKLKNSKYKEEYPLRGDHPYDVSKSSADLISYSYYKTYRVPVVITRFGNIYGEGDLNFSRIIPGIMYALINNKTLELRSDGSYIRDYLYVEDVVRGYLLLAKKINKIRGESFNFGSKETLSTKELIALIENVLHKKSKIKILNNAKNEIPYQSLNFSKAQKILNWTPKSTITSTIESIYAYYNNYLSLKYK